MDSNFAVDKNIGQMKEYLTQNLDFELTLVVLFDNRASIQTRVILLNGKTCRLNCSSDEKYRLHCHCEDN